MNMRVRRKIIIQPLIPEASPEQADAFTLTINRELSTCKVQS